MESGKKIVILDLDDTLINTKLLKKLRFDLFRQAGYSEEEILGTYESIYDSGYSTQKHADALQAIRKNGALDSIQDDHLLNEGLVFKDTISILHEAKSNPNIKSVLLSKGDPTSQQKKIDLLGLADFFDTIWISPVSKELFLKTHFSPDQEFIFINDKQSENDAIQKDFPHAVCYLIDRHTAHDLSIHTALEEIKKRMAL